MPREYLPKRLSAEEQRDMKLLVVIANYRVTHLTIECLKSLASEMDALEGAHVSICENGSGDGSAERLQRSIDDNGWNSWCSLTAVSPNRGFTGGNNVILRPALQSASPPEYVLLLNADTVVRRGALEALVNFMDDHPDVGIAASRLEDPDGTAQRSVFRFHSPLSEFERSLKLGLVTKLFQRWVVAPPVPERECEAEWVSGASMIVRKQVFDDIGVLDEGYFTYFEDTDFCFNARRAGWSIWFVPQSRVVHLGGQSTGIKHDSPNRQPTFSFLARRRYFLKNHGPLYAAAADFALIVGLTLWKLRVLFGKPDSSPPHFLWDSIKHSVFMTGFKLKDVPNPALPVPGVGIPKVNGC